MTETGESAVVYLGEMFGPGWAKVMGIATRIRSGELHVTEMVETASKLPYSEFVNHIKAHNTGAALEQADRTAHRITAVWGWYAEDSERAQAGRDRMVDAVAGAGQGGEGDSAQPTGLLGLLTAMKSGDQAALATSVSQMGEKTMRRTQALTMWATALVLGADDPTGEAIPQVTREALDYLAG